jgi:hypothetical protein
LRLSLKLHGKNAQAADTGASIEGLDII